MGRQSSDEEEGDAEDEKGGNRKGETRGRKKEKPRNEKWGDNQETRKRETQISRCTFLYLQYIYLYHTCVLKSEFGHVWLLATLVYLLKFLYVNSCVVGGRIARNLLFFFFFFFFLNLVHCMCLYIFLQLFVRRIVP